MIGKQKLFKFLRITEISETFLTDQLFYIIKNSPELNSPIDWQKFISFLSIFLKGTQEEKLRLLFLFFDRNRKFSVTKDEMTVCISSTILSMMNINYQDPTIDKAYNDVHQIALKQNETIIDSALSLMVDEIFMQFSASGDELTFEEWCNWFKSLDGMKEILEYRSVSILGEE